MLNEHVAPAVFCMCSKKNGSVCEEKMLFGLAPMMPVPNSKAY